MQIEPDRFYATSVDSVAEQILALRRPHPVRVAIDGRTASGKTTFADALAAAIRRSGRETIRASVDGFHRPRAVRHARGRLSPDGYYQDARDLDAMCGLLLDPLGPSGDRLYVPASFDLDRDEPLNLAPHFASEDAVLIVDGTFLQRRELLPAWDFVIFLDVAEEEARRRGIARDSVAMGGEATAAELYLQRYGPAFARYEAECRPAERADVVIPSEAS